MWVFCRSGSEPDDEAEEEIDEESETGHNKKEAEPKWEQQPLLVEFIETMMKSR